MKGVPGGTTEYVLGVLRRAESGSASTQATEEYLFVPSEKILPKDVKMGGLNKQGKTVALPTGVDDKTFEGEWLPQRVQENRPDQDDLWIEYTHFVFKAQASCQGEHATIGRAA